MPALPRGGTEKRVRGRLDIDSILCFIACIEYINPFPQDFVATVVSRVFGLLELFCSLKIDAHHWPTWSSFAKYMNFGKRPNRLHFRMPLPLPPPEDIFWKCAPKIYLFIAGVFTISAEAFSLSPACVCLCVLLLASTVLWESSNQVTSRITRHETYS